MSSPPSTVIARLFRGLANGQTCRVPVGVCGPVEIYLTMASGQPRLAPDPLDPNALGLLTLAQRRWEIYRPIAGLGPDQHGRFGYLVVWALDPDDQRSAAGLRVLAERALKPAGEQDRWALMGRALAAAGYEVPGPPAHSDVQAGLARASLKLAPVRPHTGLDLGTL
jgi:hypothetical protein